MVKLTGTITAVSVLAGGLWALCAGVFGADGWTAPACLAAGVASGVDLILGIIQDATSGETTQNSNDPDKQNKIRNAVQWHKVHDNGFLEAYDGRLHELFNSTETHHMVDLERGYHHMVSMKGEHAVVKTDFTQSDNKCDDEPEEESLSQMRSRRTGGLEKRLSRKQRNRLDDATYYAQKIGGHHAQANKKHANQLGRDIANGAYKLGTWCVSIHKGGANAETIGDIGLTLGGQGFNPTEIEPPCRG